jgi:hypothetical protein
MLSTQQILRKKMKQHHAQGAKKKTADSFAAGSGTMRAQFE